jgi:hypothetical protein
MLILDKRLQLMIDADRDRRLRQESKRTGVPVGEIVRRAIDQALPPDVDRAEAVRRFLALADPPDSPPQRDWEDEKREMLNEAADRLTRDLPSKP